MCGKKNSVAEPWQYFTPSQLKLSDTDVTIVQELVGSIPDAKIGRDTIYNMIAYIYRTSVLKGREKKWYDCKWHERKDQ